MLSVKRRRKKVLRGCYKRVLQRPHWEKSIEDVVKCSYKIKLLNEPRESVRSYPKRKHEEWSHKKREKMQIKQVKRKTR